MEPRCEFESGANYFALRFPPRGRAYTEPSCLFVCLPSPLPIAIPLSAFVSQLQPCHRVSAEFTFH